jgi:DNA-binding NarL/FixJ family response regulator
MSSDTPLIRILAVDDHKLIRRGIAALVATEPDMRVVAEATNGREGVKEFCAHRPDITLMDLQMPEMSGLDAIIAIRGEYPEARIIVLTTYAGDVQALRALKAGARAYLLKEALDVELLDTIRAVHAGRKSISPEVSFQLTEHATDDALTAGAVRVLSLIAEGKANKEIAKRLSVSEATVKGQVQSILSKLGASDRTHAAMIGDHPPVKSRSERMVGDLLLDLSPQNPIPVRLAACGVYSHPLRTARPASDYCCCVLRPAVP